jgi:large subunit ribosomal protein L18
MSTIITATERRKQRVRYRVKKHANGKLRLSVHRSGKHIYAQLIDDSQSLTVTSASTRDKAFEGKQFAPVEFAAQVGALVAERAKALNVLEVVFDRGQYIFHGRVKALADGARAGGLKF